MEIWNLYVTMANRLPNRRRSVLPEDMELAFIFHRPLFREPSQPEKNSQNLMKKRPAHR